MADGRTLRLHVTQGASDCVGSPPDHRSGDLGLVATTEILQSQTSDLRPGLCRGWSSVPYPVVGGLLASLEPQEVKAPLCFHDHYRVGFWGGGQGPIRQSPALLYRSGCQTPNSR